MNEHLVRGRWKRWLLVPAVAVVGIWIWRSRLASTLRQPVEPEAVVTPGPPLETSPSERIPLVESEPDALARDVLTGTLDLSVQWWDGTPAEGVELEARPLSISQPYQGLRHARSDDTGLARLPELPVGRVAVRALSRERGLVSIAADVPEIKAQFHRYDLPAGRTVQEVLVLPRGVDLHLRVLDTGGKAVESAQIWAGAGKGIDRLTHVEVARTDHEGRATVRSANPRYSILATDQDGNASMEVAVELAKAATDGDPCVLRLEFTCASLSGRVLDRGGRALPGARVRVIARDPAKAAEHGGSVDAMVLSAEDGSFALAGLAAGSAHVFVDAPEHAPWTGEIDLDARMPALLEVLLDEGFRAFGRMSCASGEEVTRGSVAARKLLPIAVSFAWRDYYDLSVKADETAAYEIRWLPAGEVELEASGNIGASDQRAVETKLRGVTGSAVEWNPLFPASACIRGVALDENGASLAGHCVVAHASPVERPSQRRYDSDTKDDGSFEICGLDAIEYDLTLHEFDKRPDGGLGYPDTGAWIAIERRLRPGGPPVVLRVETMPDLGALLGRFVGPDGTPAGSGDLRIHSSQVHPRVGLPEAKWIGDRFRVAPLEPGEYELTVFHAELGYALLGTFVIAPGEARDLGDIPLGVPGALEVDLDPLLAEELQATSVSIRPAAGSDDSGYGSNLNKDGRASFERLQAGEYLVKVRARYGAIEVHPARVRSGETTSLRVELSPGVCVWLYLRDSAAASPAFERAVVRVREEAGDGEWTLGTGRWSPQHQAYIAVGALRPGRYTWQARAGGAIVAEGSFDLAPTPKEQTFEAELLPGRGR